MGKVFIKNQKPALITEICASLPGQARRGFLVKQLVIAAVAMVLLGYSYPSFSQSSPARQAPSSYSGQPDLGTSDAAPDDLKGVSIDEQLGKKIPLDLSFVNQNNEVTTLGAMLADNKPLILSPVYFSCTTLCNHHLNGLVAGLKEMDWKVGDNFKAVAISFDPREDADLAAGKRESYIAEYGRPISGSEWEFLTGDEKNVKALMSALGFNYKFNEEANEWVHASAAILISPDGTITRYLPGIVFSGKDIKLAVTEAANGTVGSFLDQMILYCFKFNPHLSRYTLYAFNLMKVAGAMTVVVLMVWLLPVWIRARKHANA